MKSKNLASRQDLLQTDEMLLDKGSLGKVPENLDSDLSSLSFPCESLDYDTLTLSWFPHF